MAELDYAFLADYAAVQGGKLTAVGASFTRIIIDSFPSQQQLYIAGRIRANVEEPPCGLHVRFAAPDDSIVLEGVLEMDPSKQEPYRGNTTGILFTVGITVPLPQEGLYSVALRVGEYPDRILKYSVESLS